MKTIGSFVSLFVVALVPMTAFGSVAAVKVECQGNDCQSVALSDVCGALGSGYAPFAIGCDDTSGEEYSSQYACGTGGATCEDNAPISGSLLVGRYCDDGDGNDAVVMCSNGGSPTTPSGGKAIKVECQGDCNHVTLQQICGPVGMVAVGLACDDVATPGTGSLATFQTCGATSSATCRQWGTLASSDPLGAYCADGGGYDAVVNCAPALPTSVKAVKVECQGNCGQVRVGDVCSSVGSTKPIQISCDDTATPGTGTLHNPCGPLSWGGASCRDWGILASSDPVGAYCGDGGGNDVVVTCEM